uniref:Uncharacterized protein n=1 Tax=Hydrogenovibrio crunogenus (strain DSM 25203 / XCL-2) TaxID=317025 RepID=Q31GR5_HYDCU
MKSFSSSSLVIRFLSIVLVSVLLSSCFGSSGSGNSSNDSALDSEIFNSPSYTANWGTTGVFTNASTCATCHTGNGTTVMEFNGKDISPATQWKHGVMAHSLNDPYYNAVVEEEGHLFPDKKVFIENTCLRCHAPMGYTHAHQNPELLVPDPTGLLPDGGYAFETAMSDPHSREGISCTACHQMQDPMVNQTTGLTETEMPISNMSGNYKINSPAENGTTGPKIFGPFNPLYQSMQNATQYIPEYAAHMSDSAKCATCHNLYTPTLNLDGELHKIDPATGNYDPAGTVTQFPEQAPYWEWLNSRYPADGKTCQACHMPEPVSSPAYQTAVTTRPVSAVQRSNFSQHEMVGGNSYLLGLLSKYMVELGIADKTTEAGFNEKIAQTQSLLQSAVDFTLSQSLVGSTLTIPVEITNNAGHKLPSSFPSRRIWVHLKVTDSAGQVVFESGKHEEGRIEGKDDLFTSSTCLASHKISGFDSLTNQCYEPHHDVITSSDQVMIYEDVLGDVNQDITHVLLHARQYLKDNRLPPKGWTESNRHQNPVDQTLYDDDIVGAAVSDANFASGKTGAGSDGKDTVTYQVNTTGFSAPFSVEAELLYQTIRPSFVDSMHADDEIEGDSYVGRFKAMYKNTPPEPEVLATYPSL